MKKAFSRFTYLVLGTTLAFSCDAVSSAEVNVYSFRQPELILPMLEKFTEKTGIEVNVSFVQSGLIERLQAEGRRSPADIILTTDISRLHAAVAGNVTQSIVTQTLDENIPNNFRSPNGDWYALTLRARIVYASKDRVQDGELTTYVELADPKWKGRICIRPGTHSYNLGLTSAFIAHFGEDKTLEWLSGIKNNLARRPQGNDRAQVKAIWAGECDISLGNTYYMGKMLDDPEQWAWAESVKLIFPRFEGGGTHVNVSGMALARFSPNRGSAVMLMEFLSSSAAQELYAQINYEYPVNSRVPVGELVANWGNFESDKLGLETIGSLRPKALQLTEAVDFDG